MMNFDAPPLVLVIEDNPDFAQLMADILAIKGCEPLIALSPRVGLQLARNRTPRLIFCDIGFPGPMSGLDFARALRADPNVGRTPLVAISGYSSDEHRHRAIEAGFDMVFPKPFKFADLSSALDRYT